MQDRGEDYGHVFYGDGEITFEQQIGPHRICVSIGEEEQGVVVVGGTTPEVRFDVDGNVAAEMWSIWIKEVGE